MLAWPLVWDYTHALWNNTPCIYEAALSPKIPASEISLKNALVSYFEQFDAFCYHTTQSCITYLHGKTLAVWIIEASTVYFFEIISTPDITADDRAGLYSMSHAEGAP